MFDLNSPEYCSYRYQLDAARKSRQIVVPVVAGTSRGGGGLPAAASADFGQFVTVRRGAVYREEDDDTEDSDTEYRREAKERNLKNMKNRLVCQYDDSDSSSSDQHVQPKYEGSRYNQDNFPDHESNATAAAAAASNDSGPSGGAAPTTTTTTTAAVNKKKRKSRWDVDSATGGGGGGRAASSSAADQPACKKPRVDRHDPEVIRLAVSSFGSVNLDEEQWAKVEQQFQIKRQLVYNEMVAKRAERQRGGLKFEYDSDEDVDGGTWEHKLRKAEMESTRSRAEVLASLNQGRHHIGDFLPPDELKRFMEQHEKKKNGRADETPVTDYQDKKLTEENKGFQMLQKLGWKDGEGLGASGSGIVNPINK